MRVRCRYVSFCSLLFNPFAGPLCLNYCTHPIFQIKVDVVSVLGTDQNVTSNINKWHLDAQGVRQRFQGRNRQQHDILMLKDDKVLGSIEELHENGEDAVSLDATTLEFAKNENEYLFVDFCKFRA